MEERVEGAASDRRRHPAEGRWPLLLALAILLLAATALIWLDSTGQLELLLSASPRIEIELSADGAAEGDG